MERLPLSSVRTFAVVARLLSFSRAAEELNITPSAISHQIRILEDYLSTRLFRREKNKITLTPAGEQYMAQISEGLILLARATRTLKAAKGQPVLRIGCPPSLAILWLIERIGRFMKLHPDLGVALTAVPDPTALPQGSFDVGFWYGSGAISGLTVDPLGANRVFPICKPSLVKGEHPLGTPVDLARCTLVDSTDEIYYQYKEPRQPSWMAWLQAAGHNNVTGKKYVNFTPRLLMHKAIVAGHGVGLSRTLLAVDALAAREIAVPFGPAFMQPATYNLVFASDLAKRKDVAAFREWVLAEAAASTRRLERMVKVHIAK